MKARLSCAVATIAVVPAGASRPQLGFSFLCERRPLRQPPAATLHRAIKAPSLLPPSALLLQHPRYNCHSRGSPFILFATTDDKNDESLENELPDASQTDNKSSAKVDVPTPPKYLALGYTAASLLNVLAGLNLISNIGSIGTSSVASASDATTNSMLSAASATASSLSMRHQTNILATYTAGSLGHLLLAAGTCNILSKSVKTGRLFTSADTYKRLTMGTLMFGLVGLFSLPGEAGLITSSASSAVICLLATQLAKFATAFVSFVGWEYSAGGFGSANRLKNIAGEIGRSCKHIWKSMLVTEERPATFYRTFFILLILGNSLFNIPELLFNLRQGVGLFSLSVSLTISSIARLILLSVMAYVLKDAAERKRLEGTTFIMLNSIVGLWAFAVGIAQGLADTTGPFNVRRAADKLLFGLLFVNNGVLSQLSKMGIISKRDEVDPDADPPLRIMF